MGNRIRFSAKAMGAALAAAAIGAAALAGCSASSDSASVAAGSAAFSESSTAAADPAEPAGGSNDSAGAGEAAEPQAAYDLASAPDASAPRANTGVGTVLVPDRQIIRTAEVTLKVEVEPDAGDQSASAEALADAAARVSHAVRALATQPGAYVSGSDGHGASISVTLRIPAGNYDSVMGRLSTLGVVTSQSESTSDVTGEMVDVSSRIKTMQASVDRLRVLMADADAMKDVIAIESELTSRQADLESLQRRQASLTDQVALSTISVTVNAVTAASEVVEPEPVKRSAFVAGVLAGWHGIAAVGRVFAAASGALLPFLPPLALLGAAGWLLAGRIRRSKTARMPAPGSPTSES